VANPFVQNEVYDVEITDPRDGEKWPVVMRVLNAGDRAALQDETVIETDDSGEDRARVPMGRLRMKAVERAVVSWGLPLPPTAETIAVLHEGLFDQLYANVRNSGDTAAAVGPTEPPAGSSSLEPSAEVVS
jgi:hypothetical protein